MAYTGTGTQSDPYVVSTLPDLITCLSNGNVYVKVAADIDCAQEPTYSGKITTYLKKWWPKIIFLEGTDPEYIDQILDYTENAEHDDAPDSLAGLAAMLFEKPKVVTSPFRRVF